MKMNNLNILYLLIIATWYIHITEEVDCNRYHGPNGARRCIKLRQFNDYQWATCRTDSYIQGKTNGKHVCRNFAHIYCYYQCMLEIYGANSGDVFGGCRCLPETHPASPNPTSSSNPTSLSKRKTGVIVGTVVTVLVVILIVACFVFRRVVKGRRRDVGNVQIAADETADRCQDRRMPRVLYSESRPPPYSESGMPQAPHTESKPPPYSQCWLPQTLYPGNGPPSYFQSGPPQVVYEQPTLDSSTTIPHDANVQSLSVYEEGYKQLHSASLQ